LKAVLLDSKQKSNKAVKSDGLYGKGIAVILAMPLHFGIIKDSWYWNL